MNKFCAAGVLAGCCVFISLAAWSQDRSFLAVDLSHDLLFQDSKTQCWRQVQTVQSEMGFGGEIGRIRILHVQTNDQFDFRDPQTQVHLSSESKKLGVWSHFDGTWWQGWGGYFSTHSLTSGLDFPSHEIGGKLFLGPIEIYGSEKTDNQDRFLSVSNGDSVAIFKPIETLAHVEVGVGVSLNEWIQVQAGSGRRVYQWGGESSAQNQLNGNFEPRFLTLGCKVQTDTGAWQAIYSRGEPTEFKLGAVYSGKEMLSGEGILESEEASLDWELASLGLRLGYKRSDLTRGYAQTSNGLSPPWDGFGTSAYSIPAAAFREYSVQGNYRASDWELACTLSKMEGAGAIDQYSRILVGNHFERSAPLSLEWVYLAQISLVKKWQIGSSIELKTGLSQWIPLWSKTVEASSNEPASDTSSTDGAGSGSSGQKAWGGTSLQVVLTYFF
ncbi:MAG: hypothetical protein AB7F28_03215 [Candidatus Margulisiibacteriota bacterium]